MKRFLLIFLTIVTVACKEEAKVDYALVTGKIENPKDKVVTIIKDQQKVKEIALEPDGTFSDKLIIESGYYQLNHGNEMTSMYLEPGDVIDISLDTKQFDETITYTGKGAEKNNYLAKKYLANEKANIDFAKIYAMDEPDFLATMDEIKSSRTGLISDNKMLSNAFRILEEKNAEYEYLNILQNYRSAHAYYTKKEEFKPSEEFLKVLEDVDYNNEEDYKTIENYRQFVQNHYITKLNESDNPTEIFKELKESASQTLKNDLANNLKYNISPNNEHNKAFYDGIMALSSSDEDFRDGVAAKYHKVRKLVKGMPSPLFKDYKNHKKGTTSLSDLKGKYLYIDIWATWCGPCIREIPYLKELEQQFDDKNIEFVSISIDKPIDHKTWVEMVKSEELGGIQLLADKDWNSKFIKDYAIEGIPRFILIDPKGNIINADAPRPSNPDLVELLNEMIL